MDEYSDPRAIAAEAIDLPLREQSRMSSLMETLFGTVIGFGVAMLVNYIFMPLLFDVKPTAKGNFAYVVLFTIVSIIRSYFVRRMWNAEWWKRLF